MIYLILLLGLILRVANLNQSLWLDEAAQAIESIRPLSQQLNIAGDFQPPLFHILLHFWLYLGRSEVMMRLLPVALGILTLWGTYLVSKQLASEKIALLTTFFLSLSPFHIWYSQEIRPYALSACLGIFATYFLLRKQWVRYLLVGILFNFTIYLAPFLLLTHGVYVWIFERKLFRKWLLGLAVIVLSFLPWLASFWQQLTIGQSLKYTLPGWSEAVSTPFAKALPLTFAKFMIGRITFDNKYFYSVFMGVLGSGFALLVLLSYCKRRETWQKVTLLLCLPLLLAWFVSWFVPILAPQRVLYLLPFFYLLVSLGTASLTRLRPFPISALMLISLYSLSLYISQPRFQREQWREAVAYVETNATPQSKVVFVFPESFAPWQWYSHGTIGLVNVAPTFTIKSTELAQFAPQLQSAEKIYYFHYLTDLTDPQKQIDKFLSSLGFSEISKKDFSGVGFISIYERNFAHN